jgi:hypothetical protein
MDKWHIIHLLVRSSNAMIIVMKYKDSLLHYTHCRYLSAFVSLSGRLMPVCCEQKSAYDANRWDKILHRVQFSVADEVNYRRLCTTYRHSVSLNVDLQHQHQKMFRGVKNPVLYVKYPCSFNVITLKLSKFLSLGFLWGGKTRTV